MKWLLWREFRLNGLILIAGACLLFLPYAFTLILAFWPSRRIFHPSEIAEGVAGAAVMSYVLSQLTIALLGGNAFAGERADRSAEFMAYLPVSKTRRLVSKLSLAAFVTALIWGMSLLVLWGLVNLLPWRIQLDGIGYSAKYTAITGLVMFGVGWLISSLQSSPTFAVCGGLATPGVILMGLQIAAWEFEIKEYKQFVGTGYTVISITLAVIGFSLGTWYFLKRVEP